MTYCVLAGIACAIASVVMGYYFFEFSAAELAESAVIIFFAGYGVTAMAIDLAEKSHVLD